MSFLRTFFSNWADSFATTLANAKREAVGKGVEIRDTPSDAFSWGIPLDRRGRWVAVSQDSSWINHVRGPAHILLAPRHRSHMFTLFAC